MIWHKDVELRLRGRNWRDYTKKVGILTLAIGLTSLIFETPALAFTTTTCLNGETGTCRMTDGSQADVQAAITASSAGGDGTLDSSGNPRGNTFDGDGVYLPAGAFTWSTNVIWNNKNVLVRGAGPGTCNPTASSPNCSCNSTSNTCITATSGGTRNFMNPTANSTTKMQWRISNIYVTSSLNAGAVMVNSNTDYTKIPSTAAYGFRIDNMTFHYPAAVQEGTILVVGAVFGLIDNTTMTNLSEASICTFSIIPTENAYDRTCGTSTSSLCGAYNFSLGYQPGSATRNLVIEDSKFWTSPSGVTMFDTYYYGGKVTFRNNKVWNGTFYSHWTGAGSNNGLWLEAYNNVFDGSSSLAGYPFRLQGGATGLFYNNTFKNWSDATIHLGEDRSQDTNGHGVPGPLGACDGSEATDGNIGDPSAPGWPCLAQTGRGNPGISTSSGKQSPAAPSFPTYLWNNGKEDACATCTDPTSSTCSGCSNSFTVSSESPNYIKSTPHPNGDVDWSKSAAKPSGAGTHTLIYMPLAYPHPLRTGSISGSRPMPPTGLTVK